MGEPHGLRDSETKKLFELFLSELFCEQGTLAHRKEKNKFDPALNPQ